MGWTDLTFVECSILTASKMTQMQDNILALASGADGAPPIAVNSLVWSGQGSGGSLHLAGALDVAGASSLGAVHAESGFSTTAVSSLGELRLSGGLTAGGVASLGKVQASSGFQAAGTSSLAHAQASSGFAGAGVSSFGELDVAGAVRVTGAAAGPPTANTLYRDNLAKAWIKFDGTGTIAIEDSFNVASITDNGTGQYTVTWDTDFANADYTGATASVGGSGANAPAHTALHTWSSGSIQVRTKQAGVFVDNAEVCVMAMGDQ